MRLEIAESSSSSRDSGMRKKMKLKLLIGEEKLLPLSRPYPRG
jgi:hypothetical protein